MIVPGKYYIGDKTISRQHLIVEVGPAGPADSVCSRITFWEIMTNIHLSMMCILDRHSHCQIPAQKLVLSSTVSRSVARVMSSLVKKRL